LLAINLLLVEVSLRINTLMQAKESMMLGGSNNKELLFVMFHEG
jgi:hypothetical protein